MRNVYSVGQVNHYVKNMFTQDYFLRKVYVKGEVSNCKYHTSGHIYFSLKDETGTLSCVMFAGHRRGLAFRMKDGDKVVVGGAVDVYERDGRYQLYAKEITLEGAGALYERYLALKQELEDMGMFAQEYKQPIPHFIHTLGVVTAPTGAAVQDIRNIAGRRNPYLQVILYPALVQGEGAVASIVRGIRMLDESGVDVIIVGRGGGSIEELWAFNEEEVARAIFECHTPVISAVGHETDFTIADFVADLRAPTPSAAAELAVADLGSILQSLRDFDDRLNRLMEDKVREKREKLETFSWKLERLSPGQQLLEKRQRLADLDELFRKLMEGKIRENRQALAFYIERLNGASPLKKLNQGYAYVAGGNVYFDTSKLERYYIFNDHNEEDLAVGVREGVEEDTNKRNRNDFVLWFTKSKFEDQALKWDSPWGVGYPGWHIECSGISMKYNGEYLDLHCGGIDNAFPHHTNEIAQSESYLGHPWCPQWCHVAHLNTSSGKMSKSKGEFLTVSLLEEKGYAPVVYRFFCLQSHYRKSLVFSWENLDNAAVAYGKLIARIAALPEEDGAVDTAAVETLQQKFRTAMDNDLNTSMAVTVLYDVLKAKTTDATKLAALDSFDQVLGLKLTEKAAALRKTQAAAPAAGGFTVVCEDGGEDPQVEALIRARADAKKAKNFAEADRIRDELKAQGVEITDVPGGVRWKRA